MRHWGLDGPLACVELAGYDDRNLRLTGIGGNYVFKVHNAGDSLPEEQFAEAQNALMRHLAAAGLPVPALLTLSAAAADAAPGPYGSSSGCGASDGFTLRAAADDGQMHAMRIMSWMPGTLLVDVQQSAELYSQLGAMLGRVNRALQGWDWPASGVLQRDSPWSLLHLASTFQRVHADLLSPQQQGQLPGLDVGLLERAVAAFHAATSAAGGQLRRCIIHSDANERNVLVDAAAAAAAAATEAAGAAAAEAAAEGGVEPAASASTGSSGSDGSGGGCSSLITGLIDWGDASWQWLAAEPAIAMAYAMLLEHNIGDPLPAGAALLRGYERQLPLLPAERSALRALVMGRLAQSLSLGALAAVKEPGNAAYLLSTQKNGWRLLRLLWDTSDEQFLAAMPPSP